MRRPSLLHSWSDVGHFRIAYTVQFLDSPADLFGQLFRRVLPFVFHHYLQINVRSGHRPNDTITAVKCTLCETRKPRRFCPGVNNQICAPCCGESRENTVNCPLDCEYLLEAREHENYVEINPDSMPNRDIQLSDAYLEQIDGLLNLFAGFLCSAAIETEGSTDADVRDALEALIKSYRTRQSGLIYDSVSDNALAAAIQRYFNERLEHVHREMQERTGGSPVRDADVLGALVFWQRAAHQINNGRRRGRTFITLLIHRVSELRMQYDAQEKAPEKSLIVP